MFYSVCGMIHIKYLFLIIEKRVAPIVVAMDFLSPNLKDHVPYFRHHVTVNEMC